jgi:hypothetical protein
VLFVHHRWHDHQHYLNFAMTSCDSCRTSFDSHSKGH